MGRMHGWTELLTVPAGERNMAEIMRCDRKIGEKILVGQTEKKKGNKSREGFLDC
jgi:hypothetical protein